MHGKVIGGFSCTETCCCVKVLSVTAWSAFVHSRRGGGGAFIALYWLVSSERAIVADWADYTAADVSVRRVVSDGTGSDDVAVGIICVPTCWDP